MRVRSLVASAVTLGIGLLILTLQPAPADAHRSGCHRWHTCRSDHGTYVCGDLGYPCQDGSGPPTAQPAPVVLAPVHHRRRVKASYPVEVPELHRPVMTGSTFSTVSTFQDFWEQSGGLAIFGYAKTPVYIEENGLYAQVFERNRLEYHPENDVPYDIELGLLGETRLQQQGYIWQNQPASSSVAGCRFFSETGHNVCEPFLSYWNTHGLEFDGTPGTSDSESLALFGYPITEAFSQSRADGGQITIQWFQRARMEDHDEQGVMLGLLGNEVFGR